MRRGSATINLAPRRNAVFMRSASTGCASVVFEPMTNLHCASSISAIEFVMAPAPNDLTRPYTVGACHVAAQLWTLLVPSTPRASFCSA